MALFALDFAHGVRAAPIRLGQIAVARAALIGAHFGSAGNLHVLAEILMLFFSGLGFGLPGKGWQKEKEENGKNTADKRDASGHSALRTTIDTSRRKGPGSVISVTQACVIITLPSANLRRAAAGSCGRDGERDRFRVPRDGRAAIAELT